MKKKVKKWCDTHSEQVALIVVAGIGIPLGILFANWFYHRFDEPWIVRRNLVAQSEFFAVFLTLWFLTFHFILCLINRKNPLHYINHYLNIK